MKTDHIIPHKRLPTTTLERLPVLFSPSLSLSLSSYYHLSLTLTYFTWKHITEYMNRKYLIWPTCGVSFPTLWVIGSFITTSTLQASFSLGMANFRSSSDRKAELPFITLTPRFTLMKVGLAKPRRSSSRAFCPPQHRELMPTGANSFRPLVKSLQQRRASVFLPEVSAPGPRGRARGPDKVPQDLNMPLLLQTQTRRSFRQSQGF